MTSTPGRPPGSSDSPEPDDGDSPTDSVNTGPTAEDGDSTAASGRGHDAAPATEPASEAADTEQVALAEASVTASESPEPAGSETAATATAAPTGWARQQPPPAQGWARWAPPSGTQPPPQPGPPQPSQQPSYGGPRWGPTTGGWQQRSSGGWGRQPAAPKPGVIPLRPLGVGEILDGAIATLRLHWRAIVGTTFAVGLVTQSLNVVFQHQFVDDSRINDLQNNPNPSVGDIVHALGGSLAASGLSLLVAMIGTIIATSMLTVVVSRSVLGHKVTATEAWRDARPQLPRLIGLTLLIPVLLCGVLAVSALPGALISLAGAHHGGAALATLGLLAGCVVALRLWIQWSLASPALMLERHGVMAAIKRSSKLVRGVWWRVLGVQVLSLVFIFIVSSVIELPFMLIGAAVTGDSASSFLGTNNTTSWTYLIFVAIGGVLGAGITLPISAGVTTLLYMDQRIRRESLDLELIRATRKK